MTSVVRPDPAELRALPAVAPFLVRPGCRVGPRTAVSTGLAALDDLLGGGFPRGAITELVGPRGCGRTTVLLASLARVTAGGALAALIDAGDGLDPGSARDRGVALEQLLWVRGVGLRQAIRAADIVVRGGGFELIAVDLGELAGGGAPVAPAAVVRLQRAVEGTGAALVFSGLRRVGGSLATAAVALSPARAAWERGGPGLLRALASQARLVRARDRAPGAAVELVWAA